MVNLLFQLRTFLTQQILIVIVDLMQQQFELANTRSCMVQKDETNDRTIYLQLEGECKIKNTKLLEFSHLKAGLFFLPIILTIVGLFLLKYYKSLRAKIFYWEANRENATHLYIKGYGKREQQIVELHRQGQTIVFFYKKLKYQLQNTSVIPLAINYLLELETKFETEFIKSGLSQEEVEQRRILYGKNEHIVDPPKYFQYLYQVMTEPFFFIQYLAAVIYIIERLAQLSFLLLGSSIITTSVNYILLYISYKKIKQIAERIVSIDVIRNGKIQSIPSNYLVPGDLFIPNQQIFCDSILLRGQVYVNESNLTGESVPICKYPVESYKSWNRKDTSKWIYQGSKIMSNYNALAMAVHVGYSSKRGRILRKILNRPAAVSNLFTVCIYFLAINYCIAVIAYMATMRMRIQNGNLQGIIIFLNFLIIVTFCFPPGCPIYFNLVYSFCLMRLKWNNILGTQPQKTVESSHLKIMCFDKTGTLTENVVQLNAVYKFEKDSYREITDKAQQQKGLDFKIFASCHTVREFDNKLQGDQIDLKMFLHSSYSLKDSKQQDNRLGLFKLQKKQEGICYDVYTKPGLKFNRISILKIFQYQSRFQSMSVLVYDYQTSKYFVFAKGAPQVINKNSVNQYEYFDRLLQNVSHGGYRCIAYAYKQIPDRLKDSYLYQTRQNYLKDLTMLGLLVFQNKLKEDAYETIKLLEEAGIQSKMITGDNVYIGVQTAIRCGIISRLEEVILIEGKDQVKDQSMTIAQIKLNIKQMKFNKQQISIEKKFISFNQYLLLQKTIVVDNDFLQFSQNLKMNPRIKVFARTSPQKKADVVKRFKSEIQRQRKSLPRWKRIFCEEVDKVGMVGDGANDLLAIRQANIGIGIRNCDSSYAASFSIQNLKDIDYIVRQAKCGQRQIIEIIRFIAVTSFMGVPLLIIMQTQGAYFSSFQLILGNLTKYIIFNILLALSRPILRQTIHKTRSNFLRLQNQLVFWGNVIIGAAGHIAILIYYRTTDEYVWGRSKITISSGWITQASIVPSQYLFYSFHPIAFIFGLYLAQPFKQPFYKNGLLFVVWLLNVAIIILQFAIYSSLQSFFGFLNISNISLGYIALICAVDGILIIIFNSWIHYMKFHQEPNSLSVNPFKQDANPFPTENDSSQA